MSSGAKSFIVIVVVVAVAAGGIYFAKQKSNNSASNSQSTENSGQVAGVTSETKTIDQPALPDTLLTTDIIFFYGSTCSHCKKVEQFFSDYQMDKRVTFEQKEVYDNQDNAQLMTEKQALCKDLAEADKGGVPFMYSSKKCIVGDQPIIDYFKQLTGIE